MYFHKPGLPRSESLTGYPEECQREAADASALSRHPQVTELTNRCKCMALEHKESSLAVTGDKAQSDICQPQRASPSLSLFIEVKPCVTLSTFLPTAL